MRDMFVAQDFVNAFRQQQEINYQINKEHGFEEMRTMQLEPKMKGLSRIEDSFDAYGIIRSFGVV